MMPTSASVGRAMTELAVRDHAQMVVTYETGLVGIGDG
jgi:hypothetical protein